MKWIIIVIFLVALIPLLLVYVYATFSASGRAARDAGWKKLGWGAYKTGRGGGPYQQPDDDKDAKSE